MAENVKRLRTGAKRSLRQSVDHALMPKRLDFEAASSSSSDDGGDPRRSSFSRDDDEENCDPIVPSPVKCTPPHRVPPPSVPEVRLHSGSPSVSRQRPRGVRLFHNPRVVTSPVTAPKPKLHPRLLFSPEDAADVEADAEANPSMDRRRSAPANVVALVRTPLPGGRHRRRGGGWDEKKSVRKSRLANINPFTPTSLNISSSIKMARAVKHPLGGMFTPTTNGEFDHEDLQRTLEQFMSTQKPDLRFESSCSDATAKVNNSSSSPEVISDLDSPMNPAKRLRVSDINIARYEEEFMELQDIATGMFGQVKIARHRLDGMVYAIKVTRSEISGNNQERSAMNEVFAHAALMKHKHVVRYYNSWVENGRIFIQNEYCEGGSLANLIKKKREEGKGFSENELKRITTHLAKGLQYIHSKNLVHLDIKPENIFIALDHLTANTSDNDDGDAENAEDSSTTSSSDEDSSDVKMPSPPEIPELKEPASVQGTPKSIKAVVNDSTDSGNASDGSKKVKELERVSYKIGDLGHVAQVNGDYIPEEGDCRYFAPELLLHEVDREKLPKADIFSLGLTLYECATLMSLPKNSGDDPVYQKIRSGSIPYVTGYCKEFNQLIKLMTDPDVMSRPSATRILSHPFVKNLSKKSRSNLELYKELKSTKQKLKALENQLAKTKGIKRLVGRGAKKSTSSYQ